MSEVGKEVSRWADAAMYRSEPLPEATRAPGGGVRPVVTLLNATPDPLGSLAALCGIYEGRVTRALSDINDAQRVDSLKAMQKTELNGPLEVVQFHFLIEGVSRAFTHQAVRNRFSFFAQESMRFAVVEGEDWIDRSAYPPSLATPLDPSGEVFLGHRQMTPEEVAYDRKRSAWRTAIATSQKAYRNLIDAGVPAEDARGLMPHSIATRYHWVVSLRTLLGEAGKRLCTQAQFEWRAVMAEVARAIRQHGRGVGGKTYWSARPGDGTGFEGKIDDWQFELIAGLLQPVCYQAGRCTFMAAFDRSCNIRDRVEKNAALGRDSTLWGQRRVEVDADSGAEVVKVEAIHPKEWLLDPGAAR